MKIFDFTKTIYLLGKVWIFFSIFPVFSTQNDDGRLTKTYQIAQKAIKKQDWAQAKKSLQELTNLPLERFPNPFTFYDLHLQLAIVEIEQGYFKDALHTLDKLNQSNPPQQFVIGSKFIYAKILAKQNQGEKAWSLLQEIKKEVPFSDWPQEQKIFHHSVSFHQDQTYDHLLAKADEAFTNQQFELAIPLYDRLIQAINLELYPKALKQPQTSTHIYFYSAKVHANLKQYEIAAAGFEKALQSLQDLKEVEKISLEYAFCLLQIQQPKKALKMLQNIHNEHPHFPLALVFQSQAYLRLKDFEKLLTCQLLFAQQKKLSGKMIDKMAQFCEKIPPQLQRPLALASFYLKAYQNQKSDALLLALIVLQKNPCKELIFTHPFTSITNEAKAYWLASSQCTDFKEKKSFLLSLQDERFEKELYFAHAHRQWAMHYLPKAKSIIRSNPHRARVLLVEIEKHLHCAIQTYELHQSPLHKPCMQIYQNVLSLLYNLH